MTTSTAIQIIASVHSGKLSPLDTVKDALQRIEVNADLGAMQEVFADEALAQSRAQKPLIDVRSPGEFKEI